MQECAYNINISYQHVTGIQYRWENITNFPVKYFTKSHNRISVPARISHINQFTYSHTQISVPVNYHNNSIHIFTYSYTRISVPVNYHNNSIQFKQLNWSDFSTDSGTTNNTNHISSV